MGGKLPRQTPCTLHGPGSRTLKRNFEFNIQSAVRWDGKLIDLHNAYDLDRFGTDLEGTEVSLAFTRNQYAVEPEGLPLKVKLTCTGNLRFAFNDLCLFSAPINAEGIEIAYFDEDCDWLSLTDETLASTQSPLGLHLEFVNGLTFRVFCDQATFSIVA